MKKLLALVLCVVMVLSLAPAAFAIGGTGLDPRQPLPESDATAKWGDLYSANKAISNTKKNIDYIYGALAADTAVFGTVQAMDSVVVDMVKGLLADVDGIDYKTSIGGVKGTMYVTHDALEKNAKSVLRNAIGGEIADYMRSHVGNYAEVSARETVTSLAGTVYNLKAIGSTNDNLTTVFAGTNDKVYTYNPTTKTWMVGNPDDFYNDLKTWVYKDKMPSTAEWAKLTTNEKAAYITGASSTNSNWRADTGTHTTVTDYQYKPEKYAEAFATAVTKALSSEKGVANLQAYAYGLMQLKAAKAVNDKMDDLADAIAAWEDGTRILDQYGFADFNLFGELSSDPLAFIDPTNLPKASMSLSAITDGNETNYFVPDFLG